MVDALSNKLTLIIKMNVQDIDDEKAEIINYGLKSIFSLITKTVIILLLAYWLGILDLMLITIISIAIYRLFAGGAHANSHITCLITTSMLYFGTIYLSKWLSLYVLNVKPFYLVIFIVNCIIIYLYAPADVQQKPIMSKTLKEKLRIESVFSMSLIVIISLTIINNTVISNILILTTLFQSITMLPVFYKILGCHRSRQVNQKGFNSSKICC
ncbi:MAG: accessory gene regulator ArgB-like protein [Deltaproteobacteria bacterium]